MDWGIVATVKAPADKVLAFIAWHLDLGAACIRVYFDDPADPAFELVKTISSVEPFRCDAAHWASLGDRPDRHQNRQSKNARHAYRASRQPWIAHLDVDEFLLPARPIPDILATAAPDQIMLRAAPCEAVHDPDLPEDIFTARRFRAALPANAHDLRRALLGRYSELLPRGLLSHSVGKAFFRTGIPGLSPRIHGAFLKGERLPGPPFDPGLRLLHFHAQDRTAWLASLPFRAAKGAYRNQPDLNAFLTGASQAQMADFYRQTQMLTPAQEEMLRSMGLLVEADLQLAQRVAALRGASA